MQHLDIGDLLNEPKTSRVVAHAASVKTAMRAKTGQVSPSNVGGTTWQTWIHLVTSSFLLLVVMPLATSSFLSAQTEQFSVLYPRPWQFVRLFVAYNTTKHVLKPGQSPQH